MAAPPPELLRRLYEHPPEAFMAARTEAVAAARRAGDTAGAKQIAALRKPTVAAWLVNLLALRRPELVDELVELAGALRTAQRNLRGDQLRELSTQRRQAVSALVAQARKLALTAQPGLSAGKLPLADVESTLTAALADEEVAALVRTGRLVRTLTYDGFGEVPKPRLRLLVGGDDAAEDAGDGQVEDEPVAAAPRGRTRTATAAGPVDRVAERRAERDRAERERAEQQRLAARRRAVEKEVAVAEQAVLDAEAKADDAGDAERQAVRTVADLEAEIADLERQRSAAQADAARRKLEHKSAQRAAAVARRRYGDARAALDELDR